MSGVPGKFRTLRRYLKPAWCKTVRTASSGAVSRVRTRDISKLFRGVVTGDIRTSLGSTQRLAGG